MQHAEALEQSRRALDHRPDCALDLVELGPDGRLEGCTLWACAACDVYLSIDPTGIIRDKGPIGCLPAAARALLDAQAVSRPPPQTRVQCARSATGWHELARYVRIGERDDRRFPCGTEIYLQCRHCHAWGRAMLEDHQIHWDGAERVPE